MVDGDDRAEAERAAARFGELATPQLWDGTQRLGHDIARAQGVAAKVPVAWDVYLYYGKDAAWTADGLPRAELAYAQYRGQVVAMKSGAGIESAGEQDELDALLARAAEDLARR